MKPPIEIKQSLQKFRLEYPDPRKVGFVMMRFGETKAHKELVLTLRRHVAPYDLTLLRSDDRYYHEDLFWNILTYIHGSSFGLAIFDRIESDVCNPNVAFELGYMYASGKPVCLLKDSSMRSLIIDLIGKLYVDVNVQTPNKAKNGLIKWLKENNILEKSSIKKVITRSQIAGNSGLNHHWPPVDTSNMNLLDTAILQDLLLGHSRSRIATKYAVNLNRIYGVYLRNKELIDSRKNIN